MPRSEGCFLFNMNTFLAGFTESLAWLKFSWLGSQLWQHYIHRRKGDGLCAAGLKPKWTVYPGQHPQPALGEAQGRDSFPGYPCANKSGRQGSPTGDVHPGFPAGRSANYTHVSLPHLIRMLSLGDDSLEWMDEGG